MLTAENFRRKERQFVAGILNITPDSFSDGGKFIDTKDAIKHALSLIDAGADIIDIGGESTRPGQTQVDAKTELERILPVLDQLVETTNIPISIDTYKSEVAERCIEHGAAIINDVFLFRDLKTIDIVQERKVPLVIMSSYGEPESFGSKFILGDQIEYTKSTLRKSTEMAIFGGVKENMIVTDPGVGFGTSTEQAIQMIRNCSEFSLGKYPVMIGPSRKRFLKSYGKEDLDEATSLAQKDCVKSGADILRLHNPALINH